MIIHSGCVCTDLLSATVDDGVFRVGIVPSYDCERVSGEISIGITDGCITSLSEIARAVVYLDHIDVYVYPPRITRRYSARTLRQINTPRALVTLYDDGDYHLMLEGGSFFVVDVPRLEQYTLYHHTLSCGDNVTLRGRDIGGDEYLITLMYTDKWRILHELSASSIKVTREGIETIDVVEDMRLHEIRTIYHGEDISRIYRATSPHVYVESMIGYLFLESYMLGYDEEARSYLSPTIAPMYEDIITLLGKYDTIEDYHGKIALYNSTERITIPRLYDIDISNMKITNVTRI